MNMTALLLKDFYTLGKQARNFLLFIVVFALMPGYNIAAMAVVYAALLPMTALAYDERAKWDSLAAMMPYSTGSIVFGKYLVGYIAVAGAGTLTIAAQLLMGAVQGAPFTSDAFLSLLLTACISLILLSVSLPIMLRFGVEKGRLAFLALFGGIAVLIMALSDQMDALFAGMEMQIGVTAAAAVGLAIVANVVSVRVSMVWYKRKAL